MHRDSAQLLLLAPLLLWVGMLGIVSAFLFKPDFSRLSWDVVMQAVGQSFFSMSLGICAMITYGSYLRKADNMFKIAGSVAIADLCIALLACVAILP